MINEDALKSILETHTELIYNLLEREERNKPDPDQKKLDTLEEYKENLLRIIREKVGS
jgi:hypothetical protein